MQRPRKARYGLRNEVDEDEIDADLLVCLLESFSYGKMYNSAREIGPMASKDEEEDDDDHKSHDGNMSVHGSTSSVSSGLDVQIENTENQIGLAANLTDLPITEQLTTETQPHAEDGEIEIEEEKNTGTETTEEPDLEKLLAKQERFDLICPNCNSCITKRVILKKRKRGQHGSPAELNPEIQDEPEEPNDIDEIEPPVKVPAVCSHSDEEEEEEQQQPEVFSCLSCLKFFVRLGTRFMLLNLFKNKREPVQQRVDGCDRPNSESGTRSPSDSSSKPPGDTEGLIIPTGGAEENHHSHPTAEISEDGEDGRNLESGNIPPSDSNPKPQEKPPGECDEHLMINPTPGKASSDKDSQQVTVHTGTSTSDRATGLQEHEEKEEEMGTEILKSIVYGGLTETITSLGVVSSAAASRASTVNILALAIANLLGGLIVLAHNLRDLRNENAGLVRRQSEEQIDRYKELLGRQANFRFHVLVAILSYILFGLIPPLVYAFSFRQTGIRNYTIVSVFSVSLVCVVLLGMIKACVREPTKSCIKSVTYYVGIAVTTSGISYVFGDIVGEYLEKLGLFDADQTGMPSVLEGIKPVVLDLASF